MKIVQHITDEQKERVILLHLKGYSKKEIFMLTGVSYWHVNAAIHKFDEATSATPYITEKLELVRLAEEKLIQMAMQLRNGEVEDPYRFNSLLFCFASSDLNNHSVYL